MHPRDETGAKTHVPSLTEAERFFHLGELKRCEESLDRLGGAPAVTFARVKLLFRERRYADALQLLLTARDEITSDDELEWCILIGAALSNNGNFADGRFYFERARALLQEPSSLKYELAYHRGIAAWSSRDNDGALADAKTLESSAHPFDRGRGHVLRSWIEVRSGNSTAQGKYLVKALNAFESCAERDEVWIARCLFTLAAISRENAMPRATNRLQRSVPRVHWADGTALERFQITRFLGLIEALRGNELAAFRLLKQSGNIAPSAAWKVVALLDRANLARGNGEAQFAQDQVNEADAIAKHVDWRSIHSEERSALLILAELLAPTAPRAATAYLQKFASLPAVDPTLAYAFDRRVDAFAAYSAGIAHKQLGNGAAALAALTSAWETFEQYNYGWRSALAASAIYELTGAKIWLTRARHAIQPWPNSWIARKIAKLDNEKHPTAKLTPTQRRVYDALLHGDSTKEIAEKLERSPNTVRNHIAAVFIAFRVKSRAQLLATTFGLSNANSAEHHLGASA